MTKKKFVSWRRVSTQRQGRSGLGLEAQKAYIDHFVERENGILVKDFCEVYTGKDLKGCAELAKAIAYCKANDCTLVIAKTDRFRNTQEALQIYEDLNGQIYFCDLPHTDKFTLTLFFALAEREALLVSIRTKAALAARKARGLSLGNAKGCDTSAAVKASAVSRRSQAQNNANNKIIWGIVGASYPDAPTSNDLPILSQRLNAMGIKTQTGMEFTPNRVKTCFHNLKKIFA